MCEESRAERRVPPYRRSFRDSRRSLSIAWTLPLFPLVIASWWLCSGGREIEFCRPFFSGHATWWAWEGETAERINRLSVYAPIGMGLVGCLLIAVSGYGDPKPHSRRAGLFIVLSLVVGPGLLVNGVMKPLWGRPRPEELVEFGGAKTYRPIWELDLNSHSKSFPSGHAAVCFALTAPAFLLFPRGSGWCFLAATVGVLYGCGVGFARVAQGAHFPSDVMWSAGINYYVGLGLYHALRVGSHAHPRRFCSAKPQKADPQRVRRPNAMLHSSEKEAV